MARDTITISIDGKPSLVSAPRGSRSCATPNPWRAHSTAATTSAARPSVARPAGPPWRSGRQRGTATATSSTSPIALTSGVIPRANTPEAATLVA